MSRVFSRLHPSLTAAMEERGWEPTPVQEHVLPDVMDGHDRLVIAPTGSGKTMAGILPLFHRCLSEGWPSLSILYITPFFECLSNKSQWRCFLPFPLDWLCLYGCSYCNTVWFKTKKNHFKEHRIHPFGVLFDFQIFIIF